MKKLVTLSIVSAMALILGACSKKDESANAAENAANETAVVEGSLADNATSDNVVLADNAVGAVNATDVAVSNAATANTTNSN